MVYKNFRLNIAVRVLLILACSGILAYCLLGTSWFFTPMVVGVVLSVTVLNLISYVEHTNRDMANLLLSIRQGGFTTKYTPGQKGKSFERLSGAFNLIIGEFQKVSAEKESHYQYLQTLNETIGAGIISYKPNGEVQLFNQAARDILQKPYLKNISDVKLLDPAFFSLISSLKSGDRVLTRYRLGNNTWPLSIDLKDFKLGGQLYKVLLLQNIQNELDENEVQAWQKLTKVLTHEIMNSVTPIASLTAAVNQIMYDHSSQKKDIHHLDEEALEDVYNSLDTVEKRSKGLLKFVEAYKDFSKDPDLKMQRVDLTALINRVLGLLKPGFEKKTLKISKSFGPASAFVQGDPVLLEGVFINLLKNATEALANQNDGEIVVSIGTSGGHYVINIRDNGPGIDKDALEKVFIPFYTTKKGGSGIGLSISKKIIKLHNGTIRVNPVIGGGEGTTFQVTLKQHN